MQQTVAALTKTAHLAERSVYSHDHATIIRRTSLPFRNAALLKSQLRVHFSMTNSRRWTDGATSVHKPWFWPPVMWLPGCIKKNNRATAVACNTTGAEPPLRNPNNSIGATTWSIASAILCIAMALLVLPVVAQKSSEFPGSTEDHVAAKGWWPTKATKPDNAYAGAATCGKCHAEEYSSQANTAMAKAALRLSDSKQVAEPPSGRFESGPYSYRLVASSDGWSLEVASGGHAVSSRVLWAFGAGLHGTSYLLDGPGGLYEAQMSSFSATHTLDMTPGHKTALEGSLEKAVGNRLSTRDAARCFACHTTASSVGGGLNPEKAVPGVHCEACHGPGLEHSKAAEDHANAKPIKTIFNPAYLTPSGSIDFCGACHRTLIDVALNPGSSGLSSIRFQPYRIEKSRCWERTEDARLTCTACHDPHEPLVRDAAVYDQKCLGCHNSRHEETLRPSTLRSAVAPPMCPKATANCVSCHMPKYYLPEMHSQFTDHMIRIVRPGQMYPN